MKQNLKNCFRHFKKPHEKQWFSKPLKAMFSKGKCFAKNLQQAPKKHIVEKLKGIRDSSKL